MFFPEKISLIQPGDVVLEIGPGSSPHPRSNAFLDLKFTSDEEKIAQRGDPNDADFGGRPVYYYDGGDFPFRDDQFDYVICSHVLEHVPDPATFMCEVFRVGKGRGYIEYPLITYEYMYDFSVHLNFVKFDIEQNVLKYLPKEETSLNEFAGVSALFYRTLEVGWSDFCVANKKLFFEGVEFDLPFAIEKTKEINMLLPLKSLIGEKKPARKFLDRIANKFGI